MRSSMLLGVLLGVCAALTASVWPFDAAITTGGWMFDQPQLGPSFEFKMAYYDREIDRIVAAVDRLRRDAQAKRPAGDIAVSTLTCHYHLDYYGNKIPCTCAKPQSVSPYATNVPFYVGHYHGISSTGLDLPCTCAYPPRAATRRTIPIAPTKEHYHYWYATGKRIFDTPCTCGFPPTHMHSALNGVMAPCNCGEGY